MYSSRWPVAAVVCALAAAAILALDYEAVRRAVDVWSNSKTYNHCFLILPICAYLVWERRDVLRQVEPSPWPLALVLIVPFAAVWWLARVVGVLEAEQFALMGMVQAAILAVLGRHAYRAAMFPLLYSLFLVPSGDFLVRPLQDFTAAFAVGMLKLTGVPVYSDGIVIEVPAGTFVVAEACAGLRFLVATVAYGVLFAGLMYGRWSKRIIFVAASIVVPIVANGLRAYGLIVLAEIIDDQAAVDADHIVYGWGFFAFVTVLLTIVGVRFREDFAPRVPRSRHRVGAPAAGFAVTAAIAVAIAAIAPGYIAWGDAEGEEISGAAIAAPEVPGWSLVLPAAEFSPGFPRPHAELAAGYVQGQRQVDVFIGYYARQSTTRKLPRKLIGLADEDQWRRAQAGAVTADIGGVTFPVAMERILGRQGERQVWAFYWVNGRFTASLLQAKIEQLKGELLGGRKDAAVIVLSTPATGQGDAAAAKALAAFAADFGPIRAALAELSRRPSVTGAGG